MIKYICNPRDGKQIRTPLILSMDPGAEKGYALLDPEDLVPRRSWDSPRVVALATTLGDLLERWRVPEVRPVWVIVEYQYGSRVTSGEISADSIIRLAFRAGFMCCEAMCKVPNVIDAFAATPHQWKEQLYSGGAHLRKDMFCERLKRELVPSELALFKGIKAENVDDVLDAIGIGTALHFAPMGDPTTLRKWRVTFDHILPLPPKRNRPPRNYDKPGVFKPKGGAS